ncbi:MAG: cobalt ECF transporter T component CbiQ [Candidatus Bipolaricaulia bacterium]
MRDSPLGRCSDLDNPIRRLDPRIKLGSTLLFILFVVLTPPTEVRQFGSYLAIVMTVILLAKLPLPPLLRRSLVIVPFVLLVGLFVPFLKGGETIGSYSLGPLRLSVSRSGLLVLQNIAIKAWLSVLSVTVLISTTRTPELLQGLRGLRAPTILVLLLSFMLRYIPLLAAQVAALRRAGEARLFNGRRLNILGNVIGTLFIRTYERGERIYGAMLARGFTGEVSTIHQPRITGRDAAFAAALLSLLILVKVVVR